MMTRDEMLSSLNDVMSKEGVAEAFKQATTIEELREVLRSNGMNATDDELDAVIEIMAESGKEGELSDTELEGVAGGMGWSDLVGIAKATWEVGTWIAGKLVYGSQEKAKAEIKKFWGF